MKNRIYARYEKDLDTAIGKQDFLETSRLLRRVFFVARNNRDLLVVTYPWVRRALVALAHGPMGNPYNPSDPTDAFYPCSSKEADMMSNYVALVMIVMYLDIEYFGYTSDPRINKAREIMHMVFGEKPCWLRFRSVCFRLLFAEAQLTEGFHYTGELFLMMANYEKIDLTAMKRLSCPNVSVCEHKCEEIMRLGEYIEYAKRFVAADGKSGIGYDVLSVLIPYARKFLHYCERGPYSAERKARCVELRRLREKAKIGVMEGADAVLAFCKQANEALVVSGGKTAFRSVPVRKAQEHPRVPTLAERQRTEERRAVVREINRRYSASGNALSIPKIIVAMRNSAYAARMRGVSDASWKRYADEARRKSRR